MKLFSLLSIPLLSLSMLFVSVANAAQRTHGISMFDELKYKEGFTHFDFVNPNAPKGGILKIGSPVPFDNFNPFIRKGVSPSGMTYFGGLPYDTLTVDGDDEPFSQYGLVAESMELADDRSYIIYYIDKRAYFHDKQPITAEDVKFSFDILKEKGLPNFRVYYGDVSKAEVIDKYTVKFYFSSTDNAELPIILGQMPILPKHYWQQEDNDFESTTLTPPLSSGPYKISNFSAGRHVTYERVEDYWAKDHPVNKGRYNFDKVRFDVYLDQSVLRQAFKAGKLDYQAENVAKEWAVGYDGEALENGWIKKEVFDIIVPIASTGFAFNLRRDKFQDRRVRKAISLAFDFEWSNKNVFYDQYLRADSFFPASEFHVSGMPSKEELDVLNEYQDELPNYIFHEPLDVPVSDGSGWNRENLKKAASLLKQAGYRVEDQRLVDKHGRPFYIEFLTNSPQFKRILLPFRRNLSILGIDMDIRIIDSAAYQVRVQDFDFDMLVFARGQSQNPGNEQTEYWGSESADVTASKNTIGIKNPVIDKIIEKIISVKTREELVLYTKVMNRLLSQEIYLVPGYHLPARRLAYWNKFSYPKEVNANASTIAHGADILKNWWYDKDKAEKLDQAMANGQSLIEE